MALAEVSYWPSRWGPVRGLIMKRLTMIASLALVVAILASPAFALSVPGMKHHVTGNVIAVDPDSKVFTVAEDKSQKTFTFGVKERAMLVGVKKGEHVRVAYSKHGTALTASSIAPKAAPARTASSR